MAFKYRPRDPSAWEKRATQQGSEFQGIFHEDYKQYTVAKGDNHIRILPPTWEDADHYGLEVYVHYGIGPDRASVICLHKMKQQRCPICEAQQRLERAGDDEGAKELRANKRVVVWLIDRKEEAKGPMLWAMPWTLDRDFSAAAMDKRSGEIYSLDDPENGFDVSFDKTGDKQLTKYIGIQPARRASSVDQDFIDYVVEFPVPNTLVWRTYDEIKLLYEGGSTPESDPVSTRTRRDDPPAREREREPERPREREREPERRRDDPPPRARAQYTPPPREPEPGSRNADLGGDDIPWDKHTHAAPRENDSRRGDSRRDDPPSREREKDPEPPPRDAATPGRSRAEELRARFGRR